LFILFFFNILTNLSVVNIHLKMDEYKKPESCQNDIQSQGGWNSGVASAHWLCNMFGAFRLFNSLLAPYGSAQCTVP